MIIPIEFEPGDSFYNAATKCQNYLIKNRLIEGYFFFNETKNYLYCNSNVNDIADIYFLKREVARLSKLT